MDDMSQSLPLNNYRCFAANSRCRGTRAYPGIAEIGEELVLAPDPDNLYSKTPSCAGHHSVWVMNATTGAKIGHISREHEKIVRSSLDGALRAQAIQPSDTLFHGHVHGFRINIVF